MRGLAGLEQQALQIHLDPCPENMTENEVQAREDHLATVPSQLDNPSTDRRFSVDFKFRRFRRIFSASTAYLAIQLGPRPVSPTHPSHAFLCHVEVHSPGDDCPSTQSALEISHSSFEVTAGSLYDH